MQGLCLYFTPLVFLLISCGYLQFSYPAAPCHHYDYLLFANLLSKTYCHYGSYMYHLMVHMKVLCIKSDQRYYSFQLTHSRTHLFLCGFYLNLLNRRILLINYRKKSVWKGHTSLSCSSNNSFKTPLSLTDWRENDGIQNRQVACLLLAEVSCLKG